MASLPILVAMASQADTEDFGRGSSIVEQVRQAIERLRPWMAKYVTTKLDWTFSENDFTEKIVTRLIAKRCGSDAGLDLREPESAELAVKESLKSLVHSVKRSAYRKGGASLHVSIPDPHGLAFALEVERQASAREILSRVPADLLPAVELLYGLGGKEEMSTRAIAAELGIKEELLRQRLCRLRSDLRRRLRKST